MAIGIRSPFYRQERSQVSKEELIKIIKNQFNEAFFWGSVGNQVTDDDKNTQKYFEYGYNINPDVYSIVNQIANKFTSIPYVIQEIKDKDSYQKYTTLNQATKYAYSFKQELEAYNLKEKAFDESYMPMPLNQPNPEQTWQEFWLLTEIFLQNTGNIYWYVLKPTEGVNTGIPVAIYVLPSQLMEIVLKPTVTIGIDNPVDYYELKQGRTNVKFQSENIIHIKYPNPNYDQNGQHLYGQSPLRAAYKNVLTTNKGLDLSVNTMKNGGAFGFIHAKDGNTDFTDEQGKSVKSRLEEMNVSTEDLGRISAISAAIGFTRLSLTTDELKPFDYFKYNIKALCNVYGWDDKLLNSDDNAKYDNMKVAEKRVVTGKIVPDITLISEAFNKHFLSLFPEYEKTCIDFKVKELPEMQQDYKLMSEWVVSLVNSGMITRNKGLAILGIEQSEDSNMDLLTVKDDILTLEDALNPLETNIT